jgi:hypothetical protein
MQQFQTEMLKLFEDYARELKSHEEALLLHPDGRMEQIVGEALKVYHTDAQASICTGGIYSHNHPGNSPFRIPSPQDLAFFMCYAPAEFRVVSPHGDCSMRAGKNTSKSYSTGAIKAWAQTLVDERQKALESMLKLGIMKARVYDILDRAYMDRIAEVLGIEYTLS